MLSTLLKLINVTDGRRSRTVRSRIGSLEALESRLLLSPWDAQWGYGPPLESDPPTPPYPYSFTKSPMAATLEIPDRGTVSVDATEKGNTLKGKFQSGNISGTIKFKGNFRDDSAPSPSDTFTGRIKVKITEPGSKPEKLVLKVNALRADV